jgi:N-methylhydantoinase A/oxoprolinase/acetone carboxylase beta subunit
VEIVNAVVRRIRRTPKPRAPKLPRGHALHRGCVVRDGLRGGDRVIGPSVIMEGSATTYVAAGWQARVDGRGHLWLER